jgi:hypothetical protein
MEQSCSKFHPRTCHEDPDGEQTYSPILSLTSALEGMGGQRHVPVALLPGKEGDPVPTLQEAEWAPGAGLDGCGKSRPPPGFDPRTFQSVTSRCTD